MFIPHNDDNGRPTAPVGTRVILVNELYNMNGVFSVGHEFVVEEVNRQIPKDNTYNLIDADGNKLGGVSMDNLKRECDKEKT